jgi:hypothetical protein
MNADNSAWDNSFIGEITDNVIEHNGFNYFRYGDVEFKYTKITVEKLTNIIDIGMDILKGIFYLPANDAHIGLIQRETVENDGSEIRTRCRYVIRRTIEAPAELIPLSKITPSSLSLAELELVRKMIMFSWIMRVSNITENNFVMKKIHGIYIPMCLPNQKFGGTCTIAPDVLDKWFSCNNQMTFLTMVQEYLKPYRSPLALRYKMQKLLDIYFVYLERNKKVEIDSWLNDVVKCLTPGPTREAVKEPRKL